MAEIFALDPEDEKRIHPYALKVFNDWKADLLREVPQLSKLDIDEINVDTDAYLNDDEKRRGARDLAVIIGGLRECIATGDNLSPHFYAIKAVIPMSNIKSLLEKVYERKAARAREEQKKKDEEERQQAAKAEEEQKKREEAEELERKEKEDSERWCAAYIAIKPPMDEVRKGRLPSPAEFRMLNLEPDLLLSYEAMVAPEIARKLKFPSELRIIRPSIFRFMAAKKKALSYKEIKLKKRQQGKGDSGQHEIFEAVNVLIKATKHDMKLHSSSIYAGAELKKMGHERGRFEIMVFLPVLVFRGELYTWLNGNVDEVNEVLLEGRCHTRRYFDNMLIGVTKGSYFKEFLPKISEDNAGLLRQICSNRSKLDEQVKMILDSPSFDGHPLMRGKL